MEDNNIPYNPEEHYPLYVIRDKGLFKIGRYLWPHKLPSILEGMFSSMDLAIKEVEKYYVKVRKNKYAGKKRKKKQNQKFNYNRYRATGKHAAGEVAKLRKERNKKFRAKRHDMVGDKNYKRSKVSENGGS